MDTMRDAKPFQELVDELAALLLNGRKATDAMRNGLWDALKDVSFSEVKSNAKRYMATATKDTPFPRPRDLRHRPPAQYDRNLPGTDANLSGWAALKAREPVRFEVEYRLARAARELAGMSTIDPGYDEWTREYQRWASVRYAPTEVQAAAVARVVNQPQGR